jgi:predicted dehydrogenase
MTPPPSTVGIVGLGFGRAHIPAFQAAGCHVVAVCQRDAAAAKAVADRYGVPHVFERWEAMLEHARPEIAVIATPPHLHHAIALRAVAQGAHVLCEKPVAMTAAEAQAMVDAAARAKRVAMTCFNWRFTPAMQELHARVADGAVGRPLHLGLRWLGARWADAKAAATWRMDRARAGHGAMGDMGVHLIDLVRWNFGEWRRVAAQAGIAYPARSAPGVNGPPDVEDYCTVLGELDSGAQVTLMVSRAAHGANEHTLEAYGTQGAVRYRVARDGPRWYEGTLETAAAGSGFQAVVPRSAAPPTAGEGDPLEVTGKATIAPLVRHFLDAIRTGAAAAPSLADGMRAQAVLDAVLASTARGGWADVAR